MIKRMKLYVLLTVLIQNLSHQIRTPLSIITGFADMLNDAIATQSRQSRIITNSLTRIKIFAFKHVISKKLRIFADENKNIEDIDNA